MSKTKRILFILAASGLLCGAYLWFFGTATMFVLEAKYVGWRMPVVKKTPTELPDQAIAQGLARRLAYFGYEFEVPWEIDEAKSKRVGQMQLVAFRSGNSLLVSRSAPKEFLNAFLSTGKGDAAILKALYGDDVLKSDYSLKDRILETTPDKVGVLTPRKGAVGNAMLLLIKGVMMPLEGESGIYRIQTGDFRGFQFGDPRSRSRSIDLEIHNEDGGFGFVFIQRQSGSVAPITQAEINRVIQSLRKSPSQS